MSNKNSNFPTNQLNNLEVGVATKIIDNMQVLRSTTKPATDEEFDERITEYLGICAERDLRIGIETMCIYLGISRTTLFNWCNGSGCSKHRQESAQMAKQLVLGFLEQLNLSGRLNPASAIFYLKNWANYRDNIDINASATPPQEQRKTIEQIVAEHGIDLNNPDSEISIPDVEF